MSTIIAALSNPFQARQRGPHGHEVVPNEDDPPHMQQEHHLGDEEATTRSTTTTTLSTTTSTTVPNEGDTTTTARPRSVDSNRRSSSSSHIVVAAPVNHGTHENSTGGQRRHNADFDDEEDDDDDEDDEDDLEAAPVIRSNSNNANDNIIMTDRMTLRELEEERELARRRTSVCLLLGVFLLFRLWIEALTQSDLGLLMLCLVGTSWCARYIRHNREREEELDRRIASYMENHADGNNNNGDGVSRPDLRMLSFQAQLALAIMESQRQMMQGGFGHPDGQAGSSGVSDEARQQWERFKYKTILQDLDTGGKRKVNNKYGSVAQDDEPTCTICLGEYEEGEELVKLPCEHVYHDECLTAWTAEHSKCPLCNLELETVPTSETSSHAPSHNA